MVDLNHVRVKIDLRPILGFLVPLKEDCGQGRSRNVLVTIRFTTPSDGKTSLSRTPYAIPILMRLFAPAIVLKTGISGAF